MLIIIIMKSCEYCCHKLVPLTQKLQNVFDSRKQIPYTKNFVCPLCEGIQDELLKDES